MIIIFFDKMLLLQRRMGIRKGRRVRRIEVLRDTPTEFELRDTLLQVTSKTIVNK